MTAKTFAAACLCAVVAGCFGATEDRPPSLRLGEEACDHCRMLINDDRFAAALTMADGETRKFDEIGCLLDYQAANTAPVRRYWVRCYRSSQWLDAQQAFFVHSPQLHTPMGCGLAAVPTFAEAREMADEMHGRVVRFDELPKVIKSQNGRRAFGNGTIEVMPEGGMFIMPSNRMRSLCLSLIALLPLAAGCNGGTADSEVSKSSGSSEVRKEVEKPSVPVPQGKAIIEGRVVFEGTPPKPRKINFGPEKSCAELHSHAPLFTETLVVNPNGTVKWMLVCIKGKVAGKYKPPAEPAVMDQVGCVFVPHVVAMMAGQEVEFRNSDPFTHNVRVTPRLAAGSNVIFTTKAVRREVMGGAELGIPLRCDIHFWMSAYLHVLSHPFFAVTGDEGSFLLNEVPPGTYTLQTWHETLKPQTRSITVQGGERKTVDFVFKGE